ncbi:TcdA/TcdB catalytic glycosyltransferase domain-containing protein [Candidatus Fukatsuia endosymbiont of Tuberolachnus salignus]|uniref:TcdA/TcdB catalytic glycosyltransferase domain-containing protein n=1 Tax=Candidatus Fukatsuia endosymbiont of Tuberolachnus salignus TaxID=3077957 RepID=UPI003CC79E14
MHNRQKEPQLYIKELALRGNIIAANDILRLLILKKQGVVCLDTDVLYMNDIIITSYILKIRY